jgi:hypothetical protein
MTCPSIILAVLLAASSAQVTSSTGLDSAAQPAAVESAANLGSAQPLFCMRGFKGLTGQGEDNESAVAVVKIASPRAITNATVSDFRLVNRAGQEQILTHAVSVEVFDRVHVQSEGSATYYLNTGGTTPWNGILPARAIRLRFRADFSASPDEDYTRFRIKIGPYVIEGPVTGIWAS